MYSHIQQDIISTLQSVLPVFAQLTNDLRVLIVGYSALEPILKSLVGRSRQLPPEAQGEPASPADRLVRRT